MHSDHTLFHNKYRILSARWKYWDYRSPGWYFVTICTRDREHYFGKIQNEKMYVSPIGKIVRDEWYRTARLRPNVKLDAFVIMPNHVHGIIVIQNHGVMGRDEARLVSTGCRISPYPNSLPAIVGSFKSACAKIIHERYPYEPFAWQPRYHDRIIRNTEALERIRCYIQNNPQMWGRDRNNK